MFKLSEKLGKLNIEQKLLFLATLFIPILVFAAYVNLILNEIHIVISEYLNPPNSLINFSVGGIRFNPYYLTIIGIIFNLSLIASSRNILNRKFENFLAFSVIAFLLLIARIFYIYYLCHQSFTEVSLKLFTSYIIEDLTTFVIFLPLLVWQISAFVRFRNQQLNLS